MFERFTTESRAVVASANEAAAEFGHDYIGTEHLLLGLIRRQGTHAHRVLEHMDITAVEVQAQVGTIVGRGDKKVTHRSFTPRAKKVVELALREALQLGHNHVATEHLLLGALRQGDCVAVQVLLALQVDLDQLRTALVEVSKEAPANVADVVVVL